ncbi:hypothetical protein Tco_0491001 [Tanacetum coccineum]
MGRVKDKVFTVNLHHDGIFIANHIKELKDGIKELKTDKDVEDFLRAGYENKWFVNLYTEHHDYDVLDFLTIDGNVNETPYKSSDEYYSSDEVEEIDYVDFHTKGEENVVIKNLSTQDSFLNKLCRNNGSFSGFIYEPQPVDQEPIDDPDAASIDPLFKVKRGMRYEHPEQLKRALANYGVANGYQLWYMRNDWRCMLVYYGRNVEAVKKGRPVKKAIPVKKSVSFIPNITKRSLNSGEGCSKHGEGTSRDAEKSPQSPKWTKNVSIGQCKRAKQRALYDHEGGLIEHYERLWDNRKSLLESNPGSTCRLDVEDIVRVENSDNWCGFLALLHDDLKLQQGTGLTLKSDGHKSLHEAVRDWLPNSKHGKCTKHIYANFKKKFSGIQLQKLFLHAASCIVPQLFYSKMEEMKKINSEAYDYLIGRDPNSWSMAFFNLSVKCLAFKNGICESYHRAILLQRHKPIITMLEDIRVYLMQRAVAMHNIAINLEDQITPTVIKKLEYLKRHWTVFPSDYQLLEVRCGDSKFGVNLAEKTCACRIGNHPPLLPIVRRMHGRPRKEISKAPSENNSHVSRVGRVMRCSNYQGIGHNKASCDKEPVPKAPIQRKSPGRTRESVFGTHASVRGRDRGSRGGRRARGGRNGSGRGARGGRNGSANRGQQDEIRENLEHDYMHDLLDVEEDKRIQEEREYQEKLDEEAFQEAMEQQQMNEQIDEEREKQNREEREWEERNGDGQVPTSAQENNKGKDIHEGDADVAASRQEEPQPVRIHVKNRGRSERIAKLQGKKFKFDAQGTSSTPDKAFDWSVDKILDLHDGGVLQAQATLFRTSVLEKYKGMEFHRDLKVVEKFMLKVNMGLTEVTPHDFVLLVEGSFIDYNFTRIVPYYKAKGKVSGHALIAFASEDAHKVAWEMEVNEFGYKVVDVTGCVPARTAAIQHVIPS